MGQSDLGQAQKRPRSGRCLLLVGLGILGCSILGGLAERPGQCARQAAQRAQDCLPEVPGHADYGRCQGHAPYASGQRRGGRGRREADSEVYQHHLQGGGQDEKAGGASPGSRPAVESLSGGAAEVLHESESPLQRGHSEARRGRTGGSQTKRRCHPLAQAVCGIRQICSSSGTHSAGGPGGSGGMAGADGGCAHPPGSGHGRGPLDAGHVLADGQWWQWDYGRGEGQALRVARLPGLRQYHAEAADDYGSTADAHYPYFGCRWTGTPAAHQEQGAAADGPGPAGSPGGYRYSAPDSGQGCLHGIPAGSGGSLHELASGYGYLGCPQPVVRWRRGCRCRSPPDGGRRWNSTDSPHAVRQPSPADPCQAGQSCAEAFAQVLRSGGVACGQAWCEDRDGGRRLRGGGFCELEDRPAAHFPRRRRLRPCRSGRGQQCLDDNGVNFCLSLTPWTNHAECECDDGGHPHSRGHVCTGAVEVMRFGPVGPLPWMQAQLSACRRHPCFMSYLGIWQDLTFACRDSWNFSSLLSHTHRDFLACSTPSLRLYSWALLFLVRPGAALVFDSSACSSVTAAQMTGSLLPCFLERTEQFGLAYFSACRRHDGYDDYRNYAVWGTGCDWECCHGSSLMSSGPSLTIQPMWSTACLSDSFVSLLPVRDEQLCCPHKEPDRVWYHLSYLCELVIAWALSFMAMCTAAMIKLLMFAIGLRSGCRNCDPLLRMGRGAVHGAPLAFVFTAYLLLPVAHAVPGTSCKDTVPGADAYRRISQFDLACQLSQRHDEPLLECTLDEPNLPTYLHSRPEPGLDFLQEVDDGMVVDDDGAPRVMPVRIFVFQRRDHYLTTWVVPGTRSHDVLRAIQDIALEDDAAFTLIGVRPRNCRMTCSLPLFFLLGGVRRTVFPLCSIAAELSMGSSWARCPPWIPGVVEGLWRGTARADGLLSAERSEAFQR